MPVAFPPDAVTRIIAMIDHPIELNKASSQNKFGNANGAWRASGNVIQGDEAIDKNNADIASLLTWGRRGSAVLYDKEFCECDFDIYSRTAFT